MCACVCVAVEMTKPFRFQSQGNNIILDLCSDDLAAVLQSKCIMLEPISCKTLIFLLPHIAM